MHGPIAEDCASQSVAPSVTAHSQISLWQASQGCRESLQEPHILSLLAQYGVPRSIMSNLHKHTSLTGHHDTLNCNALIGGVQHWDNFLLARRRGRLGLSRF